METIVEVIEARGHPKITAQHKTTLMVTKDDEVGPKGDCIVAVSADKGAAELSEKLKAVIKSGVVVNIRIETSGRVEEIQAVGHPSLTFGHPRDIVIRKSGFTCGRTLAVGADKAAADLSRTLVDKLRDQVTKVKISIEVSC